MPSNAARGKAKAKTAEAAEPSRSGVPRLHLHAHDAACDGDFEAVCRWLDAGGDINALRRELSPAALWGYVRHAWSQLQWGELAQPATVRLNIADTLERSFRERIALFASDELDDDDETEPDSAGSPYTMASAADISADPAPPG